ncbi:MAG: hypothetical protein ACK526_22385 [Planctomyces sp.]|jgi:hypothetical protein
MTNSQKPTVPAGVHRIRLAGPWVLTEHQKQPEHQKRNLSGDVEPLEGPVQVSETRTTLPFDVRRQLHADGENVQPLSESESERSSRELRRKFHRPNGLSESTVVNLLIVATWKCSDVGLNGKPLSASDCEALNDISLSPVNSSAAKDSPISETVKTAFQIRYSIESLLRGFNELSIGLSATSENPVQPTLQDTPLIVISACLEILES